MAQTGATPISLYYSATTTNVPTAGNLVAGELALNTADGKLFYKDSGGVVQTLATKTAATFPNVNGATSGAVTLAAPAVAGSNTATFPAATGTVMVSGNMPAFSAYAASSQSVSSATPTKVTLGTEIFDTNNNFASSTFTPTVAGYYQINGLVRGTGTTMTAIYAAIYKNGSAYRRGTQIATTLVGSTQVYVTDVVYCNGTTDYLELYGLVSAASGATFEFNDATSTSVFSGVLVRAA